MTNKSVLTIRIFLKFLFIFKLSPVVSYGAGIAVFKDQPFHADSAANPIIYKSLQINEAPYIKIDTGTKHLIIDKVKFVAKIDVPEKIPLEIVIKSDLESIRKSYEEMQVFAERFPKCLPILNSRIDAIKNNIDKFEAGQVRVAGQWISRNEYDEIQKKRFAYEDHIRKENEKLEEQRRKTKAEADEFAASQRIKGFELYDDKWLPREEVIKLRQRDLENAQANESVAGKSIVDSVYSVFQILDDGMLIRVVEGKINQGGINTDLVFLFGAATGTAAEGDYYKGNLYWCGNYSYVTQVNTQKTVNAYCLRKEDAIERVKIALGGGMPSTGNGGSGSSSNSPNENSKLPEPLIGATSLGSGFFVGNKGYFITNAHVVDDGKVFSIYHSGKSLDCKLEFISKAADLALLKVSSPISGIEIVDRDAEIGEDVFAYGFPNPEYQGIELKITKGIISSSKGYQDDETRYQIDAAIQPGNSGGPLCDKAGRLVGVVVSALDQIAVAERTGTIPQNVNYAIKASEVLAVLRQKGVSGEGSAKPEGHTSVVSATGLVIVK